MVDEIFGDGETEAMLDIIGETVTVGGVSTKGLINLPGAIKQQQIAPGTTAAAVVIVVRTTAVPLAKVGDVLVARGVQYKVRRRLAIEDGNLTELHGARDAA